MFLQICLLVAGLRYGRKLLDRSPPPEPPPPDEPAPLPAVPARPEPPSAAADEREEIQRQFDLSLVCMGLATVTNLFIPQLRALSGVAVLYAGLPIMRRAWEMIVDEKRVGAEVLDTAGMVTTVATRHYVSSSLMFFLYAGSRRLRLMTERVVQDSMADAFRRHAEFVWVQQGDVEARVPLASVRVGDVVVVDAGAPIPVDGEVLRGLALVDQHALTGEAQPLERGVGDRVFAATVVCSGRIHIRVETAGDATVAAEFAGMLDRTADFTSSLEAQGQQIADRMALPTLTLGAAALPLVGPQGSIALLNSSFLDSMRMFIPLSMLQHLRSAADAGVLIRDGRSLQSLGQVDTIVFDKTGTLTLGQLRVRRVHPCRGVDPDELLRLAAAAEHRQSHPIARAIVDEASRRGLELPAVEDSTVELGFGLCVVHEGRPIRIGSRRFMVAHDVDVAGVDVDDDAQHLRLASHVYVALGERLLGVLELEPTVRPEIEGLLKSLRDRGFSLHLVSGDHETPTAALADALGFDHYQSGALPADKAQLVTELQARGRRVCFVGDGINDCLALTRAAVSVSFDGASPAALDSAQIVLTDLAALPGLFALADAYERDVRRLKWALGVPSALGIAGVLVAGYGVPAMTALYSVSMVAGLGVTFWPHAPAMGNTAAPGARVPEDLHAIELPAAANW
ncbi:HAD-IC family P-type ATPase [Nannocystis punicea]|uniref:P-type Zn(2+) transporter n=1 Tax=Nannocystis punicea TaxID=2995304 RepID=A0ABY7HBH9_9BACT|nr:HAD-IC family P-type ATPase [Nannocystis poenicansa]WAS96623.1 HAD-IC family P-type ATPase [Nannocystis poenicansa]